MKREDLEKYFSESEGLERDLAEELQKSARNGWRFGWAMFVIALGSVIGAAFAYNREPPETIVLRVDNTTGVVERATTLREDQISTNEADDLFWINRFIINFEGYNYHTITQTYNTALLLSSPAVQRLYLKNYQDDHTARDYVLGENYNIDVKITAITPDIDARTAVVRYTTQKIAQSSSGVTEPPKHWVANMRYEYALDATMSTADRRDNPKAFQVVSFRADPELFSPR